MSHTPGPWTFQEDGEVWSLQNYMSVCNVFVQPQWFANRQLIAAAPDLLQALEEIKRICDAAPLPDDRRVIRAIALVALTKGAGAFREATVDEGST